MNNMDQYTGHSNTQSPGKNGFDLSGHLQWYWFNKKYKILSGILNPIASIYCRLKGVKFGKKNNFHGIPRIIRYPGSSIEIGSYCTINSRKKAIYVHLHQPSTFVTQRKGALIKIGNRSGLSGVAVLAANQVIIGDNVLIGANTTIMDNDFHHPDPRKRRQEDFPARPVIIENNVFIGFNCIILKGVRIGENATIGANSVVLSNIPRDSIAIGNPCKVIMKKNLVPDAGKKLG